MTTQTEKKILDELVQIKHLLVKISLPNDELSEEDVLKIIEEGEKEYKEGKTEELNNFLRREYPNLAD